MPQYIEGSAHISENGTVNGSKGDQKQKDRPDMNGEVSLQNFDPSRESKGWNILRPKDPAKATLLANKMIKACNNANIGYSQADRNHLRSLGDNATSTELPTNCDCSSLVRQCVRETFGDEPDAISTSNAYYVLKNYTVAGQHPLEALGSWNSYVTLYNGDILITRTKGHTLIIVHGSPREGQQDTTGYGLYGASYFKERLDKPDKSDEFYVSYKNGGKSLYPPVAKNGLVVPDNAAYAWGRFSEILGEPSALSRSKDPGTWFRKTEDGYERSQYPKVGSIMCFTSYSGNGFACVVENIDSKNQKIATSQYEGNKFVLLSRTNKLGSWNFGTYVFQGFIWNPAIMQDVEGEQPAETFCKTAKSLIGKNVKDINKICKCGTNAAWSAAFVVSVAIKSQNSLNICVPNTFSCSSIGAIGVSRGMGSWLDGPALGNKNSRPNMGDIVLFRKSKVKTPVNKYYSDGCGVVISVASSSFECIEGGGAKVKKSSYSYKMSMISGYYRPKWSKVKSGSFKPSSTQVNGLYAQTTTRRDMAVREVGYLDNLRLQPSIQASKIKLSVLNYTGLLADLYSVFGAELLASDAANADLQIRLRYQAGEVQTQGAGITPEGLVAAVNDAYGQYQRSAGIPGELAFKLLKEREGLDGYDKATNTCRAVWDPYGHCWTIGVGTTNAVREYTGLEVKEGLVITMEQAYKALADEMAQDAKYVNKYDNKYQWTQGQLDALIDFTYNCGCGTLNKLLMDGDADKSDIPNRLLLFCSSGGVRRKGHYVRRTIEKYLFETGKLDLTVGDNVKWPV